MPRFLTSATRNASNLISLRHFYGAARFKDDLLEKFNQEVVRSKSLGFEEQQVKEATSKVKLRLENAALAGCEESLRTINFMPCSIFQLLTKLPNKGLMLLQFNTSVKLLYFDSPVFCCLDFKNFKNKMPKNLFLKISCRKIS